MTFAKLNWHADLLNFRQHMEHIKFRYLCDFGAGSVHDSSLLLETITCAHGRNPFFSQNLRYENCADHHHQHLTSYV